MSYYNRLLTDNELNDTDYVEQYLKYSFRIRRAKKSTKFYKNMCAIFDSYPDIIREIMDNLSLLGYNNDYFYMLYWSNNTLLNDYIYSIVVSTLKSDLQTIESGNMRISTMAKWLPREQSKINRKCDFIDNFNKLFFTNTKNKIKARCEYRKLKTHLNKIIGTLEPNLCSGNYKKIDLNLVSKHALLKHKHTLIKNPEFKNKLQKYETQSCVNMSLPEFTKHLMQVNTSDNVLFNEIWHTKYNKSTNLNSVLNMCLVDNTCNNLFDKSLDKISNIACVADLSNNTFNAGGQYLTIGLMCVINSISALQNNLMISTTNIILTGDIHSKIKQILQNINYCKQIDIIEYINIFTNANTANLDYLILISPQTILFPLDLLKSRGTKILHFRVMQNVFDVSIFNGDCLNVYTNISYCKPAINCRTRINKICSHYFRNKNGIKWIIAANIYVICCIIGIILCIALYCYTTKN